jgi:hypothetical protein
MRTGPTNRLRTRLVALLVAAPVLVAAVGIGVLETWRVVAPESMWFVTMPSRSFAEAVTVGDTLRAYELLLAGQDANQAIAVRDPGVGANTAIAVRPLLWAVARERYDMVLMLLAFGARVDPEVQRLASCFARQHGNEVVAQALGGDDRAQPGGGCPAAVTRSLLLSTGPKAAAGG